MNLILLGFLVITNSKKDRNIIMCILHVKSLKRKALKDYNRLHLDLLSLHVHERKEVQSMKMFFKLKADRMTLALNRHKHIQEKEILLIKDKLIESIESIVS